MKFTIRDLLLVMLAVALGVGWYRDRTALQSQMDRQSNEVAMLKEAVKASEASADGWKNLLKLYEGSGAVPIPTQFPGPRDL